MSGVRARRALSRRQVVQGAGVVGLGLLAGCTQVPWQAPAPRAARLGWLALGQPVGPVVQWFDAFLEGLREHGYREGDNLVIERRFADGRAEQLPFLAAQLVALSVDVIFASAGTAAGAAAKQATNTIPIVVPTGDLVGSGLATSLARPGGNVTGVSDVTGGLNAKRLELLKETVPAISRMGVLRDPNSPQAVASLQETQLAAETLGLSLHPLELRDGEPLEGGFVAAREQADALLIMGSPRFNRDMARLAELAIHSRLPAIYSPGEFAHAGGLIAYGLNLLTQYRRAAYYVDRILKGTQPSDLPIEQPMRFDFAINLKTAQTLGLTIPPHVLLQATEIIQ
jgi:putative tryptophan/tyrosine transport system substrate-binding protein